MGPKAFLHLSDSHGIWVYGRGGYLAVLLFALLAQSDLASQFSAASPETVGEARFELCFFLVKLCTSLFVCGLFLFCYRSSELTALFGG